MEFFKEMWDETPGLLFAMMAVVLFTVATVTWALSTIADESSRRDEIYRECEWTGQAAVGEGATTLYIYDCPLEMKDDG